MDISELEQDNEKCAYMQEGLAQLEHGVESRKLQLKDFDGDPENGIVFTCYAEAA